MKIQTGNIQKIALSITLAIILILNSLWYVYSATKINDLDKSADYAHKAIEKLTNNGVIVGDQNGNFNPTNTITRAEIATMLAKAFNIDLEAVPEAPTFEDVPPTHWSYKYVEGAYKAGLFKGVSDDTFAPDKQLTREEIATIL